MRNTISSVILACICLITLFFTTANAHKYIGCYRDVFNAEKRDLGASLFLEENQVTADWCEDKCGRSQFQFFGLQYGSECWCGNSYGKHGKLEETKCNTKCSGDAQAVCGGELANSVYKVTKEYEAPPETSGRPLLGLVMIVKDEAHTLPSTLITLKPYIDWYYILDTGSTDGTQDAIRRTLGPKGTIFEEPFIDYGRSRNRALELAATADNPPIFSLMLSADETVYNADSLRKFCEENRNSNGPQHEAYYVQMDVGWRFDSARLSRTDKGWRYVGRVHEYLAGPNGKGAPAIRVPNTYIRFRVTDPERRSKREYTILRILLEEVAERPTDTRASFYLARTYNVIGNHSAALNEFYRRVSLGGWQEEVYESLYAIGWQKEALGREWWEIQQAFLDCYNHSPERAEPLYAIASHWYKENKPALAYLFAYPASLIPYPHYASLWVQADVYSWQCHFIVGMTGYGLGKFKEGAKALMLALQKKPGDSAMDQQLLKYKVSMSPEDWNAIECQVDSSKCNLPAPKANNGLSTGWKIESSGEPLPLKPITTQQQSTPVSTPTDSGKTTTAQTTTPSTPTPVKASNDLAWMLVGFSVVANAALLLCLFKKGKGNGSVCSLGLPDKQV